LISLAIAAAAGFRGVMFNVGSFMDRYASEAYRSTAQISDARYPKRVRISVAQGKRAAIKSKNRAKHRAACRG
jgi:hypothetical protein